MTLTEQIISNLHKKIELIKELEQSRLFEKADLVVEQIGRNRNYEGGNDYWVMVDKSSGKILADGTRERIDKWIAKRKLEEGKVYFKYL